MPKLVEYIVQYASDRPALLQNVEAAIQNRADVNERGPHKARTPLHQAAYCGYKDVCECLINNGANVALTDEDGCTPAHLAANAGHVDVCKYLIEQAGANPNTVDSKGKSLLLQAAQDDKLPVIKYLINEQKVNVNQSDNSGETCLHLIIGSSNYAHTLESLKYLIEEVGANINAGSRKTRSTPLQVV